jgi:DNA-binding SARP family transcriptional activator
LATSPGSPDLSSREDLPGIFFSLLGPLEVRSAAGPVMAGPLKQRIALAILLCHANKVVPVTDLSDAIWGTDTPRTAHKNLQVHISLLRGLLFPGDGAERLAYRYPGYRIQVGPAELDVLAYQQLVRDGRTAARHGDIQLAASTLHRALRMWRGDALADLASVPAVGAEATHLNNHRAAVYEDWAEAELQLGNHALILEEIEEMVRRHPTRERLRRVQLLALSRSGRHVEALAEYDDLRVTLSREFGLEPSGALQHLYQAILSGDPVARPSSRAAGLPAAVGLPAAAGDLIPHAAQLPRDADDFTGREEDLGALVAAISKASASRVKVAVIGGPPGVGKTTLAVRAAHQLRERFPDGQLFMSMRMPSGRPRTALDALGHLLHMAGLESPLPRQLEERAALYRAFMAERALLLVIDDVSDPGTARWLLPGTGRSGVLVTSRRQLLALDATHHLEVRPFSGAEAARLLTEMIGQARVAAERDAVDVITARCSGLPLAIRIVGTKLRLQPHLPLTQLASRLADERRLLDTLDIGGLSLRSCAQACERELAAQDWAALRQLRSLPDQEFSLEDAAVTLAVEGPEAEHLLEVLLEAHAVVVTGDGRFEIPRWLHAYLGPLAET